MSKTVDSKAAKNGLFAVPEPKMKKDQLKVVFINVPTDNGYYEVESGVVAPATCRVDRISFGDGGTGYHCDCGKGYCAHVRAVVSFEIANEAEDIRKLEEGAVSGTGEIDAKRKLQLGYDFGEVTSAMQKEIRSGNEELATYWGLLLYKASQQYAWKRVMVCAAEDIGLADRDAVQTVCSLAQAWKFCRETSWYVSPHHLVMSIMLLCRARKSVEVDDLINLTLEKIKQGVTYPMLDHYVDQHTPAGKHLGKGDPHWYYHRHSTCGVPVNQYTRKYWAIAPTHAPSEEELIELGELERRSEEIR